MANAHNNFKPRRSRRSGIKKMKLIKANLAVLKALALSFIIMLVGCVPVKTVHIVDVNHHHNYYQRHRFTTYTSPVWIPGRGVILQTHPIPAPRYQQRQQPKKGKH